MVEFPCASSVLLAAGLLFVLPNLGGCQTSTLTFEQAISVETATMTVSPEGATSIAVSNRRLSTIEEIAALCLGDPDADSVSSLRDACPNNVYCTTRQDLADLDGDGFPLWKDSDDSNAAVHLTGTPRDDFPTTDFLSPHIAAFSSQEDLVQAALEENMVKGIFRASDIIDIAEAAGFSATQIEEWRQQFLHPSACGQCKARCHQRIQAECRGLTGRARGDCVARGNQACREECDPTCKAVHPASDQTGATGSSSSKEGGK